MKEVNKIAAAGFDIDIIHIENLFPEPSDRWEIVTNLGFVKFPSTTSQIANDNPLQFYYFAIFPRKKIKMDVNQMVGQVYRIHLHSNNHRPAWIENMARSIDLSGCNTKTFTADWKTAFFYCLSNGKNVVIRKNQKIEENSAHNCKLIRFSVNTFCREQLQIIGDIIQPHKAADSDEFVDENLKFIDPISLLLIRTRRYDSDQTTKWAEMFGTRLNNSINLWKQIYCSIVYSLHIDEPYKMVGTILDNRVILLDWSLMSAAIHCSTTKTASHYFIPSNFNSSNIVNDQNDNTRFCIFNLDMTWQLFVFNFISCNWDKFSINAKKNKKSTDIDYYYYVQLYCLDDSFDCYVEGENGKMLYKLNIDAINNEYWFTPMLKCIGLMIEQHGRIMIKWEYYNKYVKIIYMEPPSLKCLAFWKLIGNEAMLEKKKQILEGMIGPQEYLDELISSIVEDPRKQLIIPNQSQIKYYCLNNLQTNSKLY